ncbi:hypothetical protein ACLKA7_011518 [Drosophila subpalustris]
MSSAIICSRPAADFLTKELQLQLMWQHHQHQQQQHQQHLFNASSESGWNLNSTTIRDKLMFWELPKHLHFAEVYLHYIKANISAFICIDSDVCIFNVDINKRRCPKGCSCHLSRTEMRFEVYCDRSGVDIPELPIPITGSAALYFINKNLTRLPNSTLYGYSNIRELHLANNKLTSIKVEQLPDNLTYLDFRNNSLQSFEDEVLEYLTRRAGKLAMKLSGNPWKCDCDALKMLRFVVDNSNNITDRDQLKCHEGNIELSMLMVKTDVCTNRSYFKFLTGLLFGLVVMILIYFYFKQSILLWLYERNLCRSEPKADIQLKIDGFVAFSHVDLQLVPEYVEKLERGPRQYRLCFYQRDWQIGESIPACILSSIKDSKRVIILMTNNFINSSWGLFEFRTAIKATSMHRDKRLIVILYPDVDLDGLDCELKLYMKYNTYLRRDDPQFWSKLMFAMPHRPIHCTTEETQA